jgi:hypothetical protein
MGLFSWFERLINEHGSATIMKERLALKDDQLADKDRKIHALELRLRTEAGYIASEQTTAAEENAEKARQTLTRATGNANRCFENLVNPYGDVFGATSIQKLANHIAARSRNKT